MPRTQHLNHLTPNRIYAIEAEVRYTHSTPRMTTAVIEQENSQSLIKIPHTESLNITEGARYNFGFCYVGRNGWISARHPNHSIQQSNQPIIHEPLTLDQIVGRDEELQGHYLTTLLQVVNVNPVQNVIKDGKQLTVCVLNCFASGFMVDVTLWNTLVAPENLRGLWTVFSGFRLKRLIEGKFVFVSTVYSDIKPFQGNTGRGFSYTEGYENLSSVYSVRKTIEIQQQAQEKEKLFSDLKGVINGIQVRNYEGCSVCRRKLAVGEGCNCNPNSQLKEYTLMKLVVGDDSGWIEAAVFDEEIQTRMAMLNGPTNFIFKIKSTSKKVQEEVLTSHIVSKAETA